jgi:signal transduction histidine kinase
VGLFIVRPVVEAHAGSVDVQSAPAAGATVVVRLPIAGPK